MSLGSKAPLLGLENKHLVWLIKLHQPGQTVQGSGNFYEEAAGLPAFCHNESLEKYKEDCLAGHT